MASSPAASKVGSARPTSAASSSVPPSERTSRAIIALDSRAATSLRPSPERRAASSASPFICSASPNLPAPNSDSARSTSKRGVIDAQRRCAPKPHLGSEHVATGELAAAGARQPLGASFGQCRRRRVRGSELDPKHIRLLEVVAENLVDLGPVADTLLRPVCEPLVQLGAAPLRHRVVRGVPDQDVTEAKTVFAGERAPIWPDQALADERLQLSSDGPDLLWRSQIGDGAPPEDLADHSRSLEHRKLIGLEPIEPRREHSLDGGGDLQRVHRLARVQRALVLHEHAVLDEHLQHLLEEERVASGRACDGLGCVRRERAGEVLQQHSRLLAVERRQPDRCTGPGRPDLGQVAPREAADEDGGVAAPAGEVLDEVEEGRFSPLHVVEHEQNRTLPRQRLEQSPHRPVELLAARMRLGAADGLEDPVANSVGVVLALEHGVEVEPAHDLDERPVGDPLAVRQTAPLQDLRVARRPTRRARRRDATCRRRARRGS